MFPVHSEQLGIILQHVCVKGEAVTSSSYGFVNTTARVSFECLNSE
jgi:hypothetical protein